MGFGVNRRLLGRTKQAIVVAGIAAVFGLSPSASAQSVSHTGFPPLQDILLTSDADTNVITAGQDALGIGDYDDLLELIPPARNLGRKWEIWATTWSESDERGYEAFVKALGRSGCISIDDCLRSPANPYRDLEEDEIWLGDCTDMVYVLRGYYAWKRGLPFSFEDQVTPRLAAERGDDLRYTSGGNRVTSRLDITHDPRIGPRDAPSFLRRIFNIVSTAMLRVDAESDARSSFYPVEISRAAIRPGIAAYDVYGHVSLVYDVTDEGRVLLISSHPDYTVSREPFGANVLRTGPELGSGLKAWRPLELVGARRTERGTYIGGTIRLADNDSIPDYSLEQYFGTVRDATGEWEKGRFEIDGRSLPFYDYIHAALRKPGTAFDPLQEMANATDALCSAIQSRRTAVNLALYAGIDKVPAPSKLPPNIYGTYGDWERYATPSRDARLKTQAVELRHLARSLIEAAERRDEGQAYVSHNLAAALLDVYDRKAAKCRFTYKRSDGSLVRLTLDHTLERLFDLSFDPYHCAEKRWGATGEELKTCPADPAKSKWYAAQRFLRNSETRSYDVRTAFSAAELKDPATASAKDGGVGRSTPPNVDVRGYLMARAGAHETANSQLPMTIIDLSDATNDSRGPAAAE